MQEKIEKGVVLLLMVVMLCYLSYYYGAKKPPTIITKIEYIDDKCICIKCGKRFVFSDVNYLITKLENNDK
jgi:hypothetical protein|tara:strand:- start:996 stop:1208 length:213 start_codon:yes stop_codon:yes gene_type:complete